MDPAALQDWQAVVVQAVAHVLRPFFAFNQHNSLLFWPFLLLTVALSLLTFALAQHSFRRDFLKEYRQSYFTRAVWGHASAKADYRFYLVNAIVFPLLFAPLIVSGAWIGQFLAEGLAGLFGPGGMLGTGVWVNIAYTIVFFLAYDFGRYLGHWVQHRFDLLWQFHKVHHSAEVLTPFTNFRAHPVDLICMHSAPALLTGLVQGVFAWASDGSGYYLFFGLHIFVFAYNLVANLRHSHVWLSYGPVLSRLLISPAQHQIHHSTQQRHWGRNIGFALAIWDRLFGTLYVPASREHFEMGLGDGSEAQFHGVWRMYWQPVKELWQRRRQGPQAMDRGLGRPG